MWRKLGAATLIFLYSYNPKFKSEIVEPHFNHDNYLMLQDLNTIFFSPHKNLEQTISDELIDYKELIDELLTEGVDIKPYLSDSRFEIYEETKKLFQRMGENRLNNYVNFEGEEREKQFKDSYQVYRNEKNLNWKILNMKSFIKKYNYDLVNAEKTYGVEKELITSILAIESNYGSYIGNKTAFNSLVSMYLTGIDKYERYAVREIPELIILSQNRGMDLFDVKSNFAGAIGPMQAIPSSVNRTFTGADLYDMSNNIFSIANYLSYELENNDFDKRKAILGYNRSYLYVEAVLELEEHAKEIFSKLKN